MPESTGIPQIYLVIEVSQPRKEDDGSVTPAQVESVRSNVPRRYFDVRVVSPKDDVDENGVYAGSTTTYVEGESSGYELERAISPDRDECEVRFLRVDDYRVELPDERLLGSLPACRVA